MSRNVNSFLLTHLISSLYFFLVVFTARDLIPCSNAQTVSYIRIPALGRISNLGFLYDERTDTFRDSSIFRHDIPADAITETHSPIITTDIPLRNTFDEVSHIFESDMNTGVNILTGSTKPKGASSIIISMSQFTVTGRASVTMVDTYQTVVQQLQSFYDGLKSSYNTDLFQHRLATHIVTGVTWGARVAVTLQSTGTSNLQDADLILDEMNTELLNLKSGNLQTGAENSNFTIFIKADTPLPSPLPTTMKHVQKFLFQIPEQLKSLNGGKGVPLEFRLTPISVIRDHLKLDRKIDNPVHKIPSSILRRFTSIYMGYIEYEKHITDLSNRLSSQLNCALPEAIRRIQDLISDFYESKSLLSDTLKESMVQVRSGVQPVSVLYDLAQQYRRGNFSLKSFQNTVPEFDVALKKIEFCNRIQNENSNIEFFGMDQNLVSRISESSAKTIYILFTKTEFNQKHPVRFVENLNTFLKGLNGTTEEISQFIVDCDFEQPFFCSNLTDTAIHEFRNGKLTSTDFKHTVVEKENDILVKINNLENVTAHLLQMFEDQNEIKRKCSEDTCFNGGSCTETEIGTQCNCQPGYHGTKCENLPDYCENGPCQNNGACRSGVYSFTCTCPQGFNGETCEVSVDECSSKSSPCLNGGECIDEVDGYSCVCSPPWAGHTCQHKLDPCRKNPCQNEATCSPSSNYLQYVCSCVPGYNGTLCEFDFGHCTRNSSLCLNGGTCYSANGTFTCECAPGFDGPDCARDIIDDCTGEDLCRNGGSCIDKINSYSCICSVGFKGDNCSTQEPDAYDNCSALTRSSRPPIKMVNIACNDGLIPIFSHGFPAYYEYNVSRFNQGSEHCVWTLDNNEIGKQKRTDMKLKISIECERFGDGNDTLSVIQWQRNRLVNSVVLRKAGDSLTSDQFYDTIHLSFSSKSINQETGFILKVEYVAGRNYNTGTNYFYSSTTSLRYFSPPSDANSMSIVININQPIQFTVNSFDSATTSNVCSTSLYYDTFFVYEMSDKGDVRQLLKLCGKQSSAVSVSSNFPLLVVMEAVSAQVGKQIGLSWSQN